MKGNKGACIKQALLDFLLCVAETDPLRYPLPQPLDAARRLKTEALNIIKFWHDKYSPAYAKLRIANDFLKASKSFDYERTDAATRIERQRAQEERKRKEATDLRITAKVRSIVDENEPDIRKWLRETKNAIDLLYPNFATEESEPLAEDLERKDARNLHGYYAGDEIRIVIRPTDVLVKEDESNKDLFEILRDCYKMVNSYSKAVSRWLQNLHKHTTDANRDLIKLLVDMKNEIKVNLDKCKELKVDVVKRQRRAVVEGESESDYDESDDEFVDVEERKFDLKFGDSEEIPEHILDRIARIQKGEEHPEKPGPSGVQIVEDDQKPCSSKDVKPIIPTVSYGLDFKYWKDNDAKPAEIPKNVYDGMDYCKQAEADVLNEPSESVQMRVFSFVGDEHDGPKLKCRARTKNGKLCPRMDKKTCPFHGKIIPRDEEGFPKEENADAEAVEKAKERQKKEEEEFVRDIEQVTGVSLTGNRRTAKKRERTTSQVTRDRLSNKLFDKRTLKRVTDTIEAIRQAKVQKLHGHNFTHALQRK
ncbi:hypothetical protein L596_012074 [Steinernema carpocapsae]|uniref:UV-stimulated scaffold protein A C-terminal domain-containing protein n=1 Tax=Steinernema carpocapsae TaxID=34508 RepID=A0A4U5NWL7_STECR|nr:hypothetical protein L596_012074 [Steinernema carpocapsae]